MATGNTITVEDLGIAGLTRGTEGSLKAERERVERVLAIEALKRTQGNVSQAARDLGISRPTLTALLARMGVDARDFKKRKGSEA
jgi:DNA-binding NtrC family response regulator